MAAERISQLAVTAEPGLIVAVERSDAKAPDAAPIAKAEVSSDAMAPDVAPIAKAEVSSDAGARGAARIAQAAVSQDVRRAEPRAGWPSVAETSRLAKSAEHLEAKAPCEALTARVEASAISSDVRRLVRWDARPKAASGAHRLAVQHPGWMPEELLCLEPVM